MNSKNSIVLSLVISIILVNSLKSQEEKRETFHPQIHGAIMMANSHVPKAVEGAFIGITVPTWGFDLGYYFHPKWSAVIQADIIIQSFTVEEDNIELRRTNPMALVPVLQFEIFKRCLIYTGLGYELEEHENLALWRVGIEYNFEISKKFEIGLNLRYENKEEVYDTWTFGIAFNKRLWMKK